KKPYLRASRGLSPLLTPNRIIPKIPATVAARSDSIHKGRPPAPSAPIACCTNVGCTPCTRHGLPKFYRKTRGKNGRRNIASPKGRKCQAKVSLTVRWFRREKVHAIRKIPPISPLRPLVD